MVPLLAAGVPWALMMPWLIASPLNSPNTFFLISGALGYPMAIAQVVAAVSMGIVSGWLTWLLESRGYLSGQLRNALSEKATQSPTSPARPVAQEMPAQTSNLSGKNERKDLWKVFWRSLTKAGTRRLVRQLVLFVFVASAVKILVPTRWVTGLFGQDHWYSVPLAALLGVPLYLNNASSVPLAKTLIESGMSPGAVLAFLLAGAGTSLPAMSALLVLVRGRFLAVYVSLVFFGAVFSGVLYSVLIP